MIEGLKIDIPSTELKAMLQEKADAHRGKAEFYEAQTAAFEAQGIPVSGTSNDPRASLSASARSHRAKQGVFQFLAEHVVPGEIYRLQEHELQRMEFFERFF